MDLVALVTQLLDIVKSIFSIVSQLLSNPISAIVGGVILATLPRYVFWAIGLAMIAYGALWLLTSWLGVKFVW
jgi:hypothetical protein